jgi:hypothetical protein
VFGVDGDMFEIGMGKVVHDEVAGFGLFLKEQGFVADDVWVAQLPHVQEVLSQEDDVLSVHLQRLHCVGLVGVFAAALPDYPVGALSDLLSYLILVHEQ